MADTRHLIWAAIFLLMVSPIRAQRAGAATGDEYAPVRDEMNRPITAGGFQKDAPVIFVDWTRESGLDSFQHRSGSKDKRYILETPSGGVALFDYNNDGWLDIYLVNGSTLAALKGKEPAPKAALFHNDGNGKFTDVTERAGVANQRWGFGVVSGDINNDGWADLIVTNFGKDRLYRNNKDGTFTDIAETAGVATEGWTTAAALGDFNKDGYLDLFVAGYLDFNPESPPEPDSPEIGSSFCEYRGERVMCGPRGLKGTRDYLFLNNGDETFTEVAAKAGVEDKPGYYGFAASWADMDDDGLLDLLVANDSTPNYLYRNKGDGTFEDISYYSGFALNEYGREQAGMGLAIADYNNDGRLDVYMTHFSDDYNTLYRNEGDAFFMDVSFQVGVGEPSIPFLAWGTGFLDYDNDGLKDIFVANGHVYPGVDAQDWGTTWAQRPLLFRNLDGSRFEPVPAAEKSGLGLVVPARGAAFGDLDNDGRVDAVLNCIDSSPRVLKNVSQSGHHWVSLKLTGAPGSPRDAVGATVYLTAGGKRQRGDVIAGTSYASHSDLRLHFGLGSAERIEQLEILWPSGRRQALEDLPVDQILTIEEDQLRISVE
ncbi:MAG: CRTAC1 family protein [Acidobacteriota bacterium]